MPLRAVLFDFSDTLFHIRHAPRILELAPSDTNVSLDDIQNTLEDVWAASSTPAEQAKGRDLSPEAHRRCWTELFRPFGLDATPAETLMVGDNVHRDGGAASAGLTALTLPRYPGSGERGLRAVLSLV